MQKMLFALGAMGLVIGLAPMTAQKVEAASLSPASIEGMAPNSNTHTVDWEGREHRNHWRFWGHRRGYGYGYGREGYGREGYRYRGYRDHDYRREGYWDRVGY